MMTNRNARLIVALFVLLALRALPARAQRIDSLARKRMRADSVTSKALRLDSVVVRGRRMVRMGPLRGLDLRPEQLTTNVQGATGAQIDASGATGLGDFMNAQMGSVNINDYQGNALQADVLFRGFTASPQLGTPQGLSVFLDGVRVNEAFGDVVNWDLLPLNAIRQADVYPGSNPLFGLNTLGGAISLQTRSGFTDRGVEAEGSGGAWGRRQLKLSGGGARGNVAGFIALTTLDETGWRQNSPSSEKQAFGRFDWQLGKSLVTATVLASGNNLVGNGLIPIEMYRRDPTSVFVSPDETRNRMTQFTVSGLFPLSDKLNITAQTSRRASNRYQNTGQAYYAFENFDIGDAVRRPADINAQSCKYVDANHDGIPDPKFVGIDPQTGDSAFDFVPLAQPCNPPNFGGGYTVRNGFTCTRRVDYPCDEPGVVEGTPVAQISRTRLGQLTYGGSIQLNMNLERHKAMVGLSLDRASSSYYLGQQLALLDANRRAYTSPENIDIVYRAAQAEIPINDFSGHTTTASIFGSETWSPFDNLHITGAFRYNRASVSNTLRTRSATSDLIGRIDGGIAYNSGDLTQIRNGNIYRPAILCPTADIASCPTTAVPVLVDVNGPVTETSDAFSFPSLNPSLGASWLPVPDINLFANASLGARTPSTVELGCAFDGTLVNGNAGKLDAQGNPLPVAMVARSLAGPTCALPGGLAADPYLPQIRSHSYEGGVRGHLGALLDWRASVYRTDLTNDVMFVGASAQRSFFQTVGDTRREGFELGINGSAGAVSFRANYGLTNATYQSTFYMLSPHNSSADFDGNSQPASRQPTPAAALNNGLGTFLQIRVDPGAHIPGVPLHNLNAGVDFKLHPRWTAGIGMIAHSGSYVRGNENNRHMPGTTDQQIGIWYPNGDDTVVVEQSPAARARPFTEAGTVPGYVTFSLRTAVRIGNDATLSIQVSNLFNRTYYSAGALGINPFSPSISGAIGPSGWNYNSSDWQNTTFVAPGAPRAVFLSLKYTMPKAGAS